MLQIEVDLYSGRRNPRLEVDEARASEILAGAEQGRDLIPVEQTSSRLGYRGVILRSRGELLVEKAAGPRARLAAPTSGDAAIGRELALRLVDAAEPVRDREGPEILLEAAGVREQKRFLMEQIADEAPSTAHPLTEKMGKDLFQALHVLVRARRRRCVTTPASGTIPCTSGATTVTPSPPTAGPTPLRSLAGRAARSCGRSTAPRWAGLRLPTACAGTATASGTRSSRASTSRS